MRPVQEHVHPVEIDGLIQRLTEYIELINFPTQSVIIKLRQHKSTPAQQILREKKKIGEFTSPGIKLTTFCVQGRCPNH